MATHVIHNETEMGNIAEAILELLPQKKDAHVLGLRGDLGAGKTTFTGVLAGLLGITEHVTSPTFVIMKSYAVPAHAWIKELVHIDAYRIEDVAELKVLKLEELYSKEGTLICIEWPEKMQELMPGDTFFIDIQVGRDGTRTITYES